MSLLGAAKELARIARVIAASDWEAPSGGRKTWRRKKNDGTYEYRTTAPGKGGEGKGKAPSKPSGSPEAPRHRKVTPSVKSLSKVQNVMKANGVNEESDEVHEMMGFKKTLGQRVPESKKGEYYVRNEKKLKSDFLKNMNPSNYDSPEAFKAAKERVKKMPVSDFGKILAALDEEE